jgi:hypothetical protein
MLYFYLTNRAAGLYACMIPGTFIWPPLPYVAAVLLLFPRDPRDGDVPEAPRHRLNVAVAVAVALGVVVCILVLLKRGYTAPDPAQARPVYAVIGLSTAVTVAYLISATSTVLRDDKLFRLAYWRERLWTGRFLLVLAFLFGLKWLSISLSDKQHLTGIKSLISQMAMTGVAKPGVFYLAHVLYFGPILLITLFLWGPTCRLLHRYGVGLTLCAALAVVLGINSESRHLIFFLPIFVAFTIKATDSLAWRPVQYGLIAVMSLLFSKVWLTMNADGPFGETDLTKFPDQYFFMSWGVGMSNEMYLLQGAIVLVSGYVLYVTCFKNAGTAAKVSAS